MNQRAVKQIQPFEFRSDFGPQTETAFAQPLAEPADARLRLEPAELAMLLSQARAEGLAEGLARVDDAGQERLQSVTNSLNQALANLVALAGHLEASAIDAQMAETSLRLINATARRIIDGQGDLFAPRKDFPGDSQKQDQARSF
jgi:flagellar biosynthesis/type III secretory pathway protein FliH